MTLTHVEWLIEQEKKQQERCSHPVQLQHEHDMPNGARYLRCGFCHTVLKVLRRSQGTAS